MPVSTISPHRTLGLELVIDFVNTLDHETGTDQLATPDLLASWLVDHGLLAAGGARLREAQRGEAIELREALRTLMAGHNGAEADGGAAAKLEAVARRGELSVQFAADGSSRLAPRADGFTGALAGLLVPVAKASADGSWERVKACRSETCRWAFYDNSRNRSGVWCDMAVCGNRTKVRAYRRRAPGRR